MARVIPPNFDYQPNDTSALNWDEAPPAPDDYECVLDWNYRYWDKAFDKSYGGLVWAPQIRDKLFIKFGVFGTFRTPVLLDQAGFRKLCYLVVGDDDLRDYADGKYDRQSLVTTQLPKNYLPFDFARRSLEWARNKFLFRGGAPHRRYFFATSEMEALLRTFHDVDSTRSHHDELLEDDLFIDAAGQLVKTNDQVRLVNFSKKKLNGTIGTVYYHEPHDPPSMVRVESNSGGEMRISIHNLLKYIPTRTDLPLEPPKALKHLVDWSKMPPERKRKRQTRQETRKNVGLFDLSTDVKQHIASYLPLFDVEFNLRRTCCDTFWNFRKPPPDNLEYDFVYFSVSNVFEDTFEDTDEDADEDADDDTKQWHGVAHTTNDVLVAIMNHDWEINEIVISLKFIKFDRNHSTVPLIGYDCDIHRARLNPLGCHYCCVQQASHVELDRITILLDCRDDPDEIEDKEHCAVFRHCRDWTPREPRIQLRHIGARMHACGHCGLVDFRCRCVNSFPPTGGWSGTQHRIYYSPEWFENEDNFAFSAPSDSRDKSVILFWKLSQGQGIDRVL